MQGSHTVSSAGGVVGAGGSGGGHVCLPSLLLFFLSPKRSEVPGNRVCVGEVGMGVGWVLWEVGR